jgi:tRNA (guanosine-2'-O-)-methyltransferase
MLKIKYYVFTNFFDDSEIQSVRKERYEKIKQILRQRQPDLTVLTEDVHKDQNIAAIVRTCDAVGIFGIHSVNVVDPLATKRNVSKGADKWVYVHNHCDIKSAINFLQQRGFSVFAAHFTDKAIDYKTIDYTKPTAILFGAERWGVSEEAANLVDGHIIIPMLGMTQSLNVSAAASVILYEAQRQRIEAEMYNQLRLDPQLYEKLIFEWTYPKIAEAYRENQKPYPPLDENGEIINN